MTAAPKYTVWPKSDGLGSATSTSLVEVGDGAEGLKVTVVCPVMTPAEAVTVIIVCCDILVERVSLAVACPFDPVVTIALDKIPLGAPRFIVTPDRFGPFWKWAVIVIVELVVMLVWVTGLGLAVTSKISKGIVPETLTEALDDAKAGIIDKITLTINKIKPPRNAHFFFLNILLFLKYRFVLYRNQWYFG
jgi:hypothetical protein